MDAAPWTVPPLPAFSAPVAVGDGWAAWPTLDLPMVLPLAVLPSAIAADFVVRDPRVSLDRRVGLLLAADRRAEAWALVSNNLRPIPAEGRLDLELAAWVATESVRLGLPATRDSTIVVNQTDVVAREVGPALNDVYDLLALPWPRWIGPVVVFIGGDQRGIPPQGVIRPALPLLYLPDANKARERIATLIAGLALDLSAPPKAGWPAWLRVGVGEVARAKGAGEGPSPRRMRELRKAAGGAGIRAIFVAETPEPALAGAVLAPLLVPANRERWQAFLDLVRHGASGEGALRIAFAATPESL